MKKTTYALGFIFDSSFKHVLLIQKNRPAWQKGRYNGIGGHVEKNETYKSAIKREIFEETSLMIPINQWISIGRLEADDWIMKVFTCVYEQKITNAKTMTDEK